LLALGACSQAPATPKAAQLVTLFDVQALYAEGAAAPPTVAVDEGLPGGIPLSLITNGPSPGATLTWRPAFADGQMVGFLTTEAWANYDRVWTQPAYLPVTLAADGSLQPLVKPWQPIFSVGPASGFYSPFWQMVFVAVPPGTLPDALTSERQILDGGYLLTPGPGRMMSLTPPTPTELDLPTKHPDLLNHQPMAGFLDGASISYFDFGGSMFSWDSATNVVVPATIYVLTFVGTDKQVQSTPAIPTVLGAAPPGAGIPMSSGGQRNVAYWQVVTVQVPTGARVFAPTPDQLAALPPRATDLLSGPYSLSTVGIDPGSYPATITGADVSTLVPYFGRVALNPSCFDDPSTLAHDPNNPASCTWLDSEGALQANLDLSLAEPTGIKVSWEVTDVIDDQGDDAAIKLQVQP
jgi:hypothetical protein